MIEVHSLNVIYKEKKVGTLALTPERQCAFQYDPEWTEQGFSVSPFDLPLTSDLYIAKPGLFDGGFGVFNDSLPDGWGRFILDRYLKEKGEDPEQLSALQLLSLVGKSGRGALEYYPSIDLEEKKPEIISFLNFEKTARDLIDSKNTTELSIDTVFKYSGSSGGARPKIFIGLDGEEWLIKFSNSADSKNIGQTEYEYSLLAKSCGISMTETRLFEDKYFGTKRFDRTPNGKIHVISAAALLNADYRIPSLDYNSLLKGCQILTGDMKEVEALFRLMVFNVIIKNRDDHAKNFAFLFDGTRWRLAPAYDILPSGGYNGYHTTLINGSGKPSAEDILSTAKKIGIAEKRAKEILEEVRETCIK